MSMVRNGVTRLHYTLATSMGMMTSKAGAGTYALEAFPQRWHRIVWEALDIRTNPERQRSLSNRGTVRRRHDACAYIAKVIEGALAR